MSHAESIQMLKVNENRSFTNSKNSLSKRGFVQNLCGKSEFYLYEPRFETEGWGTLKMAYCTPQVSLLQRVPIRIITSST